MINAKKFNFKGVPKKDVGQPHRRDIFMRFIEWSILLKKDRAKLGILTAKAFAEKYGITQQTIINWKNRADFLELKRKAQIMSLSEDTPEVLNGLKQRCIKYGTAYDVELFLLYVEGWDRKNVIEILGEIKLGDNDIRKLVGLLPENKQTTFYETITELLAEAEHTRTHNST